MNLDTDLLTVTPLIRLGIIQNRLFQSLSSPYPVPVYYDPDKSRFLHEPNRRKLLPWMLANFFVLPWAGLVGNLMPLISHWLGHYPSLNILQRLILYCSLLVFILSLVLAVVMLRNSEEFVGLFNAIVPPEVSPPKKKKKSRPSSADLLQEIRALIFLPDGKLDVFGVLLHGAVGTYMWNRLIIAPAAFLLDIDGVYHCLRLVLQPSEITGTIQVVRFLVIFWATVQSTNNLSDATVYVFIVLRFYYQHLSRLAEETISSLVYGQNQILRVLFTLMNEWISVAAPSYLFLAYVIILLTSTIGVLGRNLIPLQFYVGIMVIGYITMSSLVALWKMAVLVDEQSRAVKENWERSQAELGNNLEGRRKRRILRRQVRAVYPISIHYGSLGAISMDTCTGYFSALQGDILSMIFIVKDIGVSFG